MPRPNAHSGRKLLQVRIPSRSYERLQRMKEKNEMGSLAEVLSEALRLYEAFLDEMDQGGVVWVERSDGTKIKTFL